MDTRYDTHSLTLHVMYIHNSSLQVIIHHCFVFS